jgi:hypothetical protein
MPPALSWSDKYSKEERVYQTPLQAMNGLFLPAQWKFIMYSEKLSTQMSWRILLQGQGTVRTYY